MQKTVAVIGGGMVGLCCAVFLQQDGHQVQLIDRRTLGRENSVGAPGIVTRTDFVPFFTGHSMADISKIASYYHIGFNSLVHLIPWAFRSWRRRYWGQHQRGITALDALQRFALPMHQELARIAGVPYLIQQNGMIKGYRSTADYQKGQMLRALWHDYGLIFQSLTQSVLYDLEPVLKDVFAHALWIPDSGHIVDPAKLGEAYLKLFMQMGGEVKRSHVTYLQAKGGKIKINTQEQADLPIVSDEVVIALGPWSQDLLLPLGYHFPLIYGRSYQQDFAPTIANRLTRPVTDIAGGFSLTPTADGIRLRTGVELVDRSIAPNKAIIFKAMTQAKQIMCFGPPATSRFRYGYQAILPDFLPVISRAHKHNHLWFAFGHHQIAISGAAVTGKLISDLIAGRQTSLDMIPYASVRFSKTG